MSKGFQNGAEIDAGTHKTIEIDGKRRQHVPSSLLRDAPSRTKPKMFGKGGLHRIDLEAIFE